jgi:hypothetical protein
MIEHTSTPITRYCIRGASHGLARPGRETCEACGDERSEIDRRKYERATLGNAGRYACRKCGKIGHNVRRCKSEIDLRVPVKPRDRRGMILVSTCAALLVQPHAAKPARCAPIYQDKGACAKASVAPRVVAAEVAP